MTESAQSLSATDLYRHCDPETLDFETTADLDTLSEVVGQPRAVEAMRFGLGIEEEGYNIFALGPAGMGKQSIMRRFFEQRAEQEPEPSDWCYVNNFDDSQKPQVIRMPAGKGAAFREDMENLVDQFGTALSAAFESEEYQSRRQAVTEEFKEKQTASFQELQQRAREQGVLIPAANVKHLMLRHDVVEAVEEGQFHIYPVETVDEGLEMMTGIPAGERDEEGNYPEDTVNHRVEARLSELAEMRAKFGESVGEDA